MVAPVAAPAPAIRSSPAPVVVPPPAPAVAPVSDISPAEIQKAPPVYLDMDQQQLDDNYNQLKYAPNQPQIVARYASNSAAVRTRLGEPKRIAYGEATVERFDLYAARAVHAPVCVFVHGGAWRQGEAKDYAAAAELFIGAGIHYAVLDFDNVITTGGELTPMADQVRRAIAFIYRHASSFGGDPNRIFIVGHSSGAHLAAVALTTDWGATFGLPNDIIKGGIVCSGMYDLVPVSLSARSNYVNFTPQLIDELSPIRHVDRLACPVLIACGNYETPEFQRQSREFNSAAAKAGKEVHLLVGDGYNHFELIETLGNPYGPLGRAALRLMRSVP
jgi:arylformamidase